MLPIERLNRIKDLIEEQQTIKISELSKLLHVSEMTIHRDLKPLIDEGFIIKTFGGISLADNNIRKTNEDLCIVCSSSIDHKLSYRLILSDNNIEMTCCAHCGLMREYQLNNKVVQSICFDFLRQTTLNAKLAWFVFDASLDMGCCQPQVLTFENKKHAQKFIKGFDGKITSFNEALDLIHDKMSLSHSYYDNKD